MPKPFSISIQVEESALGHVMRVLNRMEGVVTFDFDMDEQKRAPPKHNGATYKPRKIYEVSGRHFMERIFAQAKEPLTNGRLAQKFAADGRSEASTSSILHNMRKEGLLSSTPEGYTTTKKFRDRLRHRKGANK